MIGVRGRDSEAIETALHQLKSQMALDWDHLCQRVLEKLTPVRRPNKWTVREVFRCVHPSSAEFTHFLF